MLCHCHTDYMHSPALTRNDSHQEGKDILSRVHFMHYDYMPECCVVYEDRIKLFKQGASRWLEEQ